MSRKTYTTCVSEFPAHAPIPVMEKAVKAGNGKATFKTATAACNAAREARDEARALTNEAADYLQKVLKAKQFCELCCESMHRTYMRDMWWKVLLMVTMVADIALKLFVWLRT